MFYFKPSKGTPEKNKKGPDNINGNPRFPPVPAQWNKDSAQSIFGLIFPAGATPPLTQGLSLLDCTSQRGVPDGLTDVCLYLSASQVCNNAAWKNHNTSPLLPTDQTLKY